jgi:hypothetical protein
MSSPYRPNPVASFSSTPFDFSVLLSDGDDVTSRIAAAASGLGLLVRGQIMHIDPVTGALTAPVVATDCNCIVAQGFDATATAGSVLVYLSGKFKADAVTWPGVLAKGTVTDALRDYMILIESVMYTDGTMVEPHLTEEQTLAEAQKKADAEAKKIADAQAAAGQPQPALDQYGRPVVPTVDQFGQPVPAVDQFGQPLVDPYRR